MYHSQCKVALLLGRALDLRTYLIAPPHRVQSLPKGEKCSRRKNPRDFSEPLRYDSPPHPPASLFADDQSRFRENPCVVRDGGLALAQGLFKGAATNLVFSSDERQHAQTHRITESSKDLGDVTGLDLG